MTAKDIMKLLSNRAESRQEVFIPEIMVHYGGSKQRLDAWSIKPSWTKQQATGFEIKVDRGDFVRDDKWQEYLQCCSQFYFVCPKNLIHKEEVPEQAGLIYCTEKRTTVVKVAPYRAIEFDPFLLGIIINRMKANVERQRSNRIEFLKAEIEEDRIAKKVGWQLGCKLSQRQTDLEEQMCDLRKTNENLNDVKEFLKSMGVDMERTGYWCNYLSQLKEKLNESSNDILKMNEAIRHETKNLTRELESGMHSINRAKNVAEFIQKKLDIYKQEAI